jgi:ribosomal protein L12E/L44/L45/RPP1/RPP2
MTKTKVMTLPRCVNDSSGRPTAFNDGGWGGPSRSYTISAKNLKKKSIDEIIKQAKAASRANRTNTKATTSTGNPMVINDYRANLVDESVSEEEEEEEEKEDDDCKFS